MGNHFGTCPPISISIDGTSPKLLWYIALVIIYKPTKFLVETHRGAGSAGRQEPCARDLRTAGAVHARPADH